MDYSTLTIEQINRMESTEYAQHFNNAEFRARVDFLESQPKQAPQPRTNEQVAPAQDFSGDPSWSDTDDVAAAKARLAPAPKATEQPAAPAQPAAPVAKDFSTLPELVHEYQPTIDGKPVGGKQRFKYKTVDDPADPNNLITQLQKAHSHASARIRELSRSRKLEEIVDAGVKQTTVPRPSDEVPATPEELAKELRAVRQSNYELAIRVAVNSWLERCPEYARYKSKENNESVILAVARAGADETNPDSYVKAWETMKDVLTPVVEEAVPTPAPALVSETKAVAAAAAPVQAEQPVMIATGLSNADVFNHELPAVVRPAKSGQRFIVDGVAQILTADDLDRMPSDKLKRILNNRANAQAADAAYTQQAEAQAARRAQNRR